MYYFKIRFKAAARPAAKFKTHATVRETCSCMHWPIKKLDVISADDQFIHNRLYPQNVVVA